MALDGQGHLYAVESFDDRIAELSLQGSLLGEWGTSGSGPGQLSQPIRAAIDRRGDLYVTDSKNNRVQKFTASGKPIAQWGGPGSGPGQFNFPVGIAIDGQGDVLVAEYGNSRVQKLSPLGAPLASWDSPGASGIALDAKGDVFVAEAFGGSHVFEYSPSGSGALLATLGGGGPGKGQFNEPRGMAFDRTGDLFVGDNGNNRIQELTATGQFIAQWIGPRENPFPEQTDIALSDAGLLYVSDGNQVLGTCVVASCA